LLRLFHPGVEVFLRGGERLELLIGEARAAVLDIAAPERARLVRQQIEPRLHAGHGIDLAAEGGDDERVHHRVGGDGDADWRIDRNGQFVDHGDIVLRIDEQPLPVLRDGLNLERRHARVDLVVGIVFVGVVPQMQAKPDDDGGGHAPDENLRRPVVGEVGRIAGALVGAAVAPHKQRGHHEDRDDHDHHDADGLEQEIPLGERDGAFRIENRTVDDAAAGTEQGRAKGQRQ
jgi:hypothetical protein